MSVDSRGVTRGCCAFPGCSCFGYDGTTSSGGKCDRCGHPPAKHAKSTMMLPTRREAPVMTLDSASEDDDEVESLSLSGPSDDDPASEPVPVIKKIINSMPNFLIRSGAPAKSPRRSSSPDGRPFPKPASRVPQPGRNLAPRPPRRRPRTEAWGAPAASPTPLPTCQYPNCENPQFFDLNTGGESIYCSQHMFAPPPPSLPLSSPPQFPQSMDTTTMMTPGYMASDGISLDTAPMATPNQPHQLQHQRMVQTDFPNMYSQPQPLFHPSQSVPNFQTHQQLQPAVHPTPMQPPVPVALLPEDERCIYPLCNKRRYKEDSGKVHQFCSRTHAREYAKLKGGVDSIPPEMKCKTQGCSRAKRPREDGNGYYDYCGNSCRRGTFRTTPAAAGEKCSLPGCDRPKFVDPANGRVHDYCGITHANQAVTAGIAPQVCTIRLLGPSELSQVQSHFSSQWCSKKGTCPTITCVFQITNQQLETRWNSYKQKLPRGFQDVEKYYHGTKLKCDIVQAGSPCNDKECGVCGISKFGMFRQYIRRNINFQRFGHGFYFAPNSSKCHDYTQGVQTHRAMLLVEILPGKKHVILNDNVQLKCPPDGCHSVYGKPGQALNYAELVVYNPDCVMPRYIIVYVLNGVHKIAK